MEWKSTIDEGQFQCPACQSLQTYRLRSARPFLTIYFIPVIPIGGTTEFVNCPGCKQNFQPEILDQKSSSIERSNSNESPREASWDESFCYAMATVMCDDGHVTEHEIETALQVFEQVFQKSLNRESLGYFCSQAQLIDQRSHALFQQMAPGLTLQQKRELVQMTFLITSCEDGFSRNRGETLVQCRTIFDLAETEYKRAIEEAIDWGI